MLEQPGGAGDRGPVLALGPALRAAYGRTFRPPFEIPLALIGNAVLMTAAWFLLPPRAHAFMFSLHGPLAFPVVMASWMLGDTPSTNVAGLERDRALEVLHDPRAFRIWLAARSIVLASLVGVPCATIALVMGYQGQPVVKVAAACAVILVLPFGILPISACVGLLLPFHRRSFGWRWQHRHWRRVFRWVILLLAPFVVVPVVAGIIVGPSLLVARALGAPQIPLSSASFVLLAACIVVCALLAAWGGLRLASGLRSRRRDHLQRYLLDPEAA